MHSPASSAPTLLAGMPKRGAGRDTRIRPYAWCQKQVDQEVLKKQDVAARDALSSYGLYSCICLRILENNELLPTADRIRIRSYGPIGHCQTSTLSGER